MPAPPAPLLRPGDTRVQSRQEGTHPQVPREWLGTALHGPKSHHQASAPVPCRVADPAPPRGHPAVPTPSPVTPRPWPRGAQHSPLSPPPAAQPLLLTSPSLHTTQPRHLLRGLAWKEILTAFALVVLIRVVDLENTRRKSYEDPGSTWEGTADTSGVTPTGDGCREDLP